MQVLLAKEQLCVHGHAIVWHLAKHVNQLAISKQLHLAPPQGDGDLVLEGHVLVLLEDPPVSFGEPQRGHSHTETMRQFFLVVGIHGQARVCIPAVPAVLDGEGHHVRHLGDDAAVLDLLVVLSGLPVEVAGVLISEDCMIAVPLDGHVLCVEDFGELRAELVVHVANPIQVDCGQPGRNLLLDVVQLGLSGHGESVPSH
mmetsp:Transcript_75516/g.233615  ORF Transcript_75516/g.233615 Transcript_75516/m.233615 type:complete len:200 (-) Transcript_75516:47-646(-)